MNNKYLKYLAIILLIAFAASCSSERDEEEEEIEPPVATITLQKKELRGAWIATVWELDWPRTIRGEDAQKKAYTDLLDKLVDTGVNAVFVQIRSNGDAFYNSPYEPWSKWITGTKGKDPGYDVLAFMLKETHARGLEFHAWLNPYRIETRGSGGDRFSDLDPKINKDWVKDYDKIRIYNPALPEVRERIGEIVKDIITKYAVDGIHIDDYFYPSPGSYTSLNDEEEYKKYGAGYASIAEFRKGNIDKAVEKIYKVIVENKPEVVFSVSPTGNNDYNVNSLYADATKWCREGWVDILIPQLYYATGSTESSFNSRLNWWSLNTQKAVLMVGHGLYKFGDETAGSQFQTTSELLQQFKYTRANAKVQGSVMYSAKYYEENKLGVIDVLKNQLYNNLSLIPFAGRKVAPEPAKITNIILDGSMIRWDVVGNVRTVVYKITDNKGAIVGITADKRFTLPEKGNYCLTVLNEDNVESDISNIISYK